jgi:hypothetical protein
MAKLTRRTMLAAAIAGAAGVAGGLLWWRSSCDEHALQVELPPVRDPAFPEGRGLEIGPAGG